MEHQGWLAADGLPYPSIDFFDTPDAIHFLPFVLVGVVLGDGCCLGLVFFDSLSDDVFVLVVGPARVFASKQESLDQFGLGNHHGNHATDALAQPFEQGIQGLGLGQGPGETIENKSGGIGTFFQTMPDHPNHDVIGYQQAGVHQALGFQP
jgi:hypothetical protein